MPWLINLIRGGLIPAIATLLGSLALPLVKKVLVGLGFSYVVFQGFEQLQTYVIGQITANINALPVEVFQILAYMGVFNAMNILFSAWVIGWGIVLQKRFLTAKPAATS